MVTNERRPFSPIEVTAKPISSMWPTSASVGAPSPERTRANDVPSVSLVTSANAPAASRQIRATGSSCPEGPAAVRSSRSRSGIGTLTYSAVRRMYQQFDEQDIAQDYLHLLRRGSVVRRLAVAEHGAWRRAIRAKAQADELKVRTWSRDERPATVWAVLRDWTLTPEGRARLAQRLAWQRED